MKDGYAPLTSPHPPDWSWRSVKRRNDTGFSRIPSRLAHRARPIRQCSADPTSSRLLPPSPATPGSGCLQLRPAATTAGQWRSFTSIRNNSASRRTFCLVTDLLDHHAHPAHQLADAYRWRWDGSETALREAKSTIHDAGPATGAILRSHSPDLIRQEHAAWIVATELVHAATRSAAAIAAPFRKGPRTGQAVAARQLSFTTARRTLISTVRAGTATASLPAPTRAAAHHTALAVIATARVTTDRHRHRDHKIKTRREFPHPPRDITTRTAPAHVHVCGTTAA
jgi:hypothetical protein